MDKQRGDVGQPATVYHFLCTTVYHVAVAAAAVYVSALLLLLR